MFDLHMNIVGIEKFQILEHRIGRMMDAFQDVQEKLALTLGARIRDEARNMLGTYQPATSGPYGSYPAWAKLSRDTMRRRIKYGFNPAEEPLIETQKMLKTIHTTPPMRIPGGVEFIVGYAAVNKAALYAVWHEIGTSTMPPRPVLGPAAMHVLESCFPLIKNLTFNHFNIISNGEYFDDVKIQSIQRIENIRRKR